MNTSEVTNNKTQITNKSQSSNGQKTKIYDLEERTFQFTKSFTVYLRKLPKSVSTIEYGMQGTRSTGSVGANYIEANEALSKKDFFHRIKICRKEAKESAYWIRLLVETNDETHRNEGEALFTEAIELKKIFSSMLPK
jgi:four helix bundle protein